MLKMSKIALLGAVAVAGMASTAANAATATGTAEVDIISAITLTQTTGLDLGVVASSGTAGTVAIVAGTNVRSCTGGVTCAGTGATRGAFSVGGAPAGYQIALTVDASTTLAGPGTNMVLTLTPSTTSFTSAATATTFYVGGSAAVAASQAAGTYTGTYNVTANYQ